MNRWALAVAVAVIGAWPTTLAAQDPTEPLASHGCTGCHSLDGSRRQGPSFVGLIERADDDAIRRSIAEPDAEIAPGFSGGFMPRFDLDEPELDALVVALHAVPVTASVPPGADPLGVLPLALAVLVFVGGHFVLSSRAIRGRLVARLGEGRFAGAYSIVVGAALVGIVLGWRAAPYVALWDAPPWTRWVPNVVVPIAIFLLVSGYTTPSPTMAGGSAAERGPTGMLRVTRHPSLWGFALWALAHIVPNGDLRSLVAFSGIAILAIGGMVHIDGRRAAAQGEAWSAFAGATSLVPFAAIAAGRQRLVLRELGAWRVALSIAIWAGIFAVHQLVYGVSPMPF